MKLALIAICVLFTGCASVTTADHAAGMACSKEVTADKSKFEKYVFSSDVWNGSLARRMNDCMVSKGFAPRF